MAAPYAAPPRRRPSIVGPLILIVVGGVFLLENAGMLPRNTWQSLWRLWPVVLVLVGLELLVGQRVPWVTLLGLALVVFALGFAATTYTGFRFGDETPEVVGRTVDTDLREAKQAAVTVRFGAGELDIGPLAGAPPGRLASMTYEAPEGERLQPTYTEQGELGRLEYRLDGWKGEQSFGPFGGNFHSANMQVSLNPAVPITSLTVQGGAADADIDLRELIVNSLDLQIGAATTDVRLPRSGATNVHISGGAANINIDVPENVAARISHRGGLSTLEVNESRFPAAGSNRYQSPNYDQAKDKVDITLETGVTSIEID